MHYHNFFEYSTIDRVSEVCDGFYINETYISIDNYSDDHCRIFCRSNAGKDLYNNSIFIDNIDEISFKDNFPEKNTFVEEYISMIRSGAMYSNSSHYEDLFSKSIDIGIGYNIRVKYNSSIYANSRILYSIDTRSNIGKSIDSLSNPESNINSNSFYKL